MAWRFCRDRAHAEAMAQEAFLRAYRNLGQWRRKAAFSTWLFNLIDDNHISKTRRARELPIGSDLYDILLKYRRTHHQNGTTRDSPFFLTKDGSLIKEGTANKTFRRLRTKAGTARNDGARSQPRMHDLGHTFAVHRFTAWFSTAQTWVEWFLPCWPTWDSMTWHPNVICD
jgi:hypothetical protein